MQRAVLTLHKEFRLHEPTPVTKAPHIESDSTAGMSTAGKSVTK
jgi:hypothetical protein